jgi:hypothetical protein
MATGFPAEEFAAALREACADYSPAAFTKALHETDAERMVREGRAAVAALEARRRERARRLAPHHARALAVWQETNRRHAAEFGEFTADEPRISVAAAAWWGEPAPIVIW